MNLGSQVTQNDTPMAVNFDGDGRADLALYGPDPAKSGTYRYLVFQSTSDFSPSSTYYFDNFGNGYGNGSGVSIPVMADYQGNGLDDFAVFNPDGSIVQYVYQTNQIYTGVTINFSGDSTSSDLPTSAPTNVLAKKVRSR